MPAKTLDIPDPWTGETFITLPDPQIEEVQPYIDSLTKIPKSGLHNPYKNPERYHIPLNPVGMPYSTRNCLALLAKSYCFAA